MMPTKTLSEVLAAAQTATSLSDLSMLFVNSSGKIVKYNPFFPTIWCTDPNEAVDPGTYVLGSTNGDNLPSQDQNWRFGLLEVLKRSTTIYQRLIVSGQMAIRYRIQFSDWSAWTILSQ